MNRFISRRKQRYQCPLKFDWYNTKSTKLQRVGRGAIPHSEICFSGPQIESQRDSTNNFGMAPLVYEILSGMVWVRTESNAWTHLCCYRVQTDVELLSLLSSLLVIFVCFIIMNVQCAYAVGHFVCSLVLHDLMKLVKKYFLFIFILGVANSRVGQVNATRELKSCLDLDLGHPVS